MTMLETLQSTLDACASGGAYAMVVPQGTVAPYITWQRVVSTTENTTTGPTDVQNTRIQIDVFAPTFAGAQTVAAAVVAAMLASGLTNVKISDQDLYEPEVKLYRVLMDYSVWST